MHRIPYQTERFWQVLDGNLGSRKKWECPDISVLHQNVDVPIKPYCEMNNSETFPTNLAGNLWRTKIKYSTPKMYTPNPLLNWSTLARFWCKFWERRFRKCLEIYMTWLWECLFSWAESPPLWHTQCRSEWFAKGARSAREQAMSGGLLSSCTWCITSSHVNCVYQYSVNEHRSTEDDTHGRRQCRTWHALQRACIRIPGAIVWHPRSLESWFTKRWACAT